MVEQSPVVDRIQDLSSRDGLAARLVLAAYVRTVLVPSGYNAAVVGGTALDTYVSGGMGTSDSIPAGWQESLDIDTVVIRTYGASRVQEAREILLAQGFHLASGGQSLRLADVVYPVDLVGDAFPDDYSLDHVTTVHLADIDDLGLSTPLLAGPEDILFDYMESGWDTRHPRDWARALAVAAVMGDDLDLGYLFTKAQWRRDGAFEAPLERVLRGEPLRTEETG